MFAKNDIILQLKKMGVPADKPVLCHTSLRAVGEVEGKGEGFLDALISHVTSEGGILLIPAHTWANLNKDSVTMDVSSPETCIGTLPSIAAVDIRAHRSLHPTHSMAAFGDGAEEYIAGETEVDSSTSPDGCYGKLWKTGGSVLLIGVGHNRNTFLHSVEELMGVPNRLSEDYANTTIRLKDGTIVNRPLRFHSAKGIPDVSANYPKYEPAFRHHGCITDGFIGNAPSQLCDAVKMRDVLIMIRERSHGAELLEDNSPLDEALWK